MTRPRVTGLSNNTLADAPRAPMVAGPVSQPVAGYPAIRALGGFHFWVSYTGPDLPWGWSGEERHRCACEGSAGMTRCMLRATQEDLLCDACRATEGHGVSS